MREEALTKNRARLFEVVEELRRAVGDLPGDLQAQVAIGSAIAFVELVLNQHLNADPAPRRMRIVPVDPL